MTAAHRLSAEDPASAPKSETSISGLRARVVSPQSPDAAADAPLRDISVEVRGDAPDAAAAGAFAVEFPQDSHFFAGLSHDLASGGVFVATYRRVPVGAPVHVRFELPDGTPIDADGEVRWVRETDSVVARQGLAIAFTEMAPESLRCIAEYCRARPPLFLDLD